MAAWLGFVRACAHFTNNVAYAFQLAGYTAAIIAFPMVNITEASQLWDIAQARVCEVIVGILCGGMMMMILPSSSDATALLTALKTCTPDYWNMPVYSGSLKQPMPFVQHMRGDWTDTDHEFAPYPGFLEPLSFSPAKRTP